MYIWWTEQFEKKENPKCKKVKHIQIIKNDVSDTGEKIKAGQNVNNEEIKRAIKIYIGRKRMSKAMLLKLKEQSLRNCQTRCLGAVNPFIILLF